MVLAPGDDFRQACLVFLIPYGRVVATTKEVGSTRRRGRSGGRRGRSYIRTFEPEFERSELAGQGVAPLHVLRATIGYLAISDAVSGFVAAETRTSLSVGARASAGDAQVHRVSGIRGLRGSRAGLPSALVAHLRSRACRLRLHSWERYGTLADAGLRDLCALIELTASVVEFL